MKEKLTRPKDQARREFFKKPLSQIRARVEQMGIEASWTMAAACTEWRETAAIEKEVAAEGAAAKRWEEKQPAITTMRLLHFSLPPDQVWAALIQGDRCGIFRGICTLPSFCCLDEGTPKF